MKLERLHIQGFKTFKDVALDLSRLGHGLVFVRGRNLSEPDLESNGAGKSSLFDAMFWGLFGKTVGGLRNTDIKPWAGKTSTKVTVQVDGHEVTRTLAPNRVTLDNKDAGPGHIEKLLGLGYDLASHTILMGQGRPLFFDLPPAQKMGLLSEAMGLERWEKRARKAAGEVSRLEGEVGGLERETHSQASLEAELYQMLRRVQDQAKEWDERERVDLASVESEITIRGQRLDKAQNEYAKHDLAYDSAQTELRALGKQIRDLNQEDSRALSVFDKAERLRAELAVLDIAGICPTCGQTITKKDLTTHRDKLVQQLEALPVVDVVALGRQLDALTNAEGKLQEKSNQAMDARTRAHGEASQLGAEIAVLKKSLKQKKEEVNPFQEQVMDIKKRRVEITKRLNNLEKQVVSLKGKLDTVRFWVKGFKEVRLFILEELLQEMELVANASLQNVGLIGWEIHYEVERETKSGTTSRGINVWIKSPSNNIPVRWECWSGGESQRLKIIGAAALSDVLLAHVGVQCNIEAWDESSQYLSEAGVEDLVEFLSNRAEEQKKIIFFIDHVARESSWFSSTITITKKDGASSVALQ
jgi:DNA repair exonuclease SbcCD ATPase subunit